MASGGRSTSGSAHSLTDTPQTDVQRSKKTPTAATLSLELTHPATSLAVSNLWQQTKLQMPQDTPASGVMEKNNNKHTLTARLAATPGMASTPRKRNTSHTGGIYIKKGMKNVIQRTTQRARHPGEHKYSSGVQSPDKYKHKTDKTYVHD